jgi:hypothetical protein
MTAEALASLIDAKISPALHEVDARLEALKRVPAEHQPVVADAREFLRLRSEGWQLRAEGLRKAHLAPARKQEVANAVVSDANWRMRAEAQFRSNRTTIGRAEGAERASMEVFQRLQVP